MESCFRQCMHIKVDDSTAMMYDLGILGSHVIIFLTKKIRGNELLQRLLQCIFLW